MSLQLIEWLLCKSLYACIQKQRIECHCWLSGSKKQGAQKQLEWKYSLRMAWLPKLAYTNQQTWLGIWLRAFVPTPVSVPLHHDLKATARLSGPTYSAQNNNSNESILWEWFDCPTLHTQISKHDLATDRLVHKHVSVRLHQRFESHCRCQVWTNSLLK